MHRRYQVGEEDTFPETIFEEVIYKYGGNRVLFVSSGGLFTSPKKIELIGGEERTIEIYTVPAQFDVLKEKSIATATPEQTLVQPDIRWRVQYTLYNISVGSEALKDLEERLHKYSPLSNEIPLLE